MGAAESRHSKRSSTRTKNITPKNVHPSKRIARTFHEEELNSSLNNLSLDFKPNYSFSNNRVASLTIIPDGKHKSAVYRRRRQRRNSANNPTCGDEQSLELTGRKNVIDKLTLKNVLNSLNALDVTVTSFKAVIEERCIAVDEKSSSVLKYNTPFFRASATVVIPGCVAHKKLSIGWIQVCTSLVFLNLYGTEGLTSWELPGLVTGSVTMVSDSDGKHYPWYGAKRDVLHHTSGQSHHSGAASVALRMNDNFHPQVTWYVPCQGHSKDPKLTRIYRKQSFITCLVVLDRDEVNLDLTDSTNIDLEAQSRLPKSLRVLQAVTWSMNVDVTVDPRLPRGERVTFIGPTIQDQPKLVSAEECGTLLRCNALRPPNANSGQTLVWRTKSGPAKVVVRSADKSQTAVEYLRRTRDYYQKLTKEIDGNRIIQ